MTSPPRVAAPEWQRTQSAERQHQICLELWVTVVTVSVLVCVLNVRQFLYAQPGAVIRKGHTATCTSAGRQPRHQVENNLQHTKKVTVNMFWTRSLGTCMFSLHTEQSFSHWPGADETNERAYAPTKTDSVVSCLCDRVSGDLACRHRHASKWNGAHAGPRNNHTTPNPRIAKISESVSSTSVMIMLTDVAV